MEAPPPPSAGDNHPSHPSPSVTATATSATSVRGLPPPPSQGLPPLTPKAVTRSETSPYPTTFIQADTASFKQVVQMLTGSSETSSASSASRPAAPPPPPPTHRTGPKKQPFKLYERRQSSFRGLKINPLVPGLYNPSAVSPRNKELLSPSVLDFPSLALSPVTPLISDPFDRASSGPNSSEEERAIAEKGFYLHPSPRTKAGAADPPRLLPLFPVTSPKLAGPPPSGAITGAIASVSSSVCSSTTS